MYTLPFSYFSSVHLTHCGYKKKNKTQMQQHTKNGKSETCNNVYVNVFIFFLYYLRIERISLINQDTHKILKNDCAIYTGKKMNSHNIKKT